MNLLFIVDALFRDSPGGSRLVAEKLGQHLVHRGHKVTILAPRSGTGGLFRQTTEGVNTVCYYFNRAKLRGWASLLSQGRNAFIELTRQEGFDLLHIHFAFASLGPFLSSIARRLPCIRTFHGSWADEALISEQGGGRVEGEGDLWRRASESVKYFLRSKIEEFSLHYSDAVIVLSEYSRNQVARKYNVDPSKIRIIPGSTDVEKFRPPLDKHEVRKQLDLPQDTNILFTVRRLVPRMGLENLILAAKEVIQVRKDVLFLIGGTGFLISSLEQHIKDVGVNQHIRLLGFISEEMLPLYYQASDVFILPSVALEGFGLVTIEALSCGIPVLGTPVGATPEILARIDKNLLLRGTAPSYLAEGILNFLEQGGSVKYPPNEMRRFVMTNYGWDKIASQTEAVYQEILEGRRNRNQWL